MVKRPSLGSPATDERVEVELWGSLYRVKEVTRSVQSKLDAMDGAKFETADEAVEVIGTALEALLEPLDGQQAGARGLIVSKWQADELSLQALERFFTDLREAAENPT